MGVGDELSTVMSSRSSRVIWPGSGSPERTCRA